METEDLEPGEGGECQGLNEDQKLALERAKNGDSMFITGGAGTGKSFVLRYVFFKQLLLGGARGVRGRGLLPL